MYTTTPIAAFVADLRERAKQLPMVLIAMTTTENRGIIVVLLYIYRSNSGVSLVIFFVKTGRKNRIQFPAQETTKRYTPYIW